LRRLFLLQKKGLLQLQRLFYILIALLGCKRNSPNTRLLHEPIEFLGKGCGDSLAYYAQNSCQNLMEKKFNFTLPDPPFGFGKTLQVHSELSFRGSRLIPEYYPLFSELYQKPWMKNFSTSVQRKWPSHNKLIGSGDSFSLAEFLVLPARSFLGFQCKIENSPLAKISSTGSSSTTSSFGALPWLSVFANSQVLQSPGNFTLAYGNVGEVFQNFFQKSGYFELVQSINDAQKILSELNSVQKVGEFYRFLKPWDVWFFSPQACGAGVSPQYLFVNLEKDFFLDTLSANPNSFATRLLKRSELLKLVDSKFNSVPLKPANWCAQIYRSKPSQLQNFEKAFLSSSNLKFAQMNLLETGFQQCIKIPLNPVAP
jgi:hypothetical protein